MLNIFRSMKVLFIHPADSRKSIAPGRFEPLALEVLAATIPDHEVIILDMRLEQNRRLEDVVSHFRPDVAGVTANNTIHVNGARDILRRIKKVCPGVKQAVGGHHPTMLPQDFYLPEVDAIFLGWAEKSFPAWIGSISSNDRKEDIPGIKLLEKGNPRSGRDNLWDLKPRDIPYPRRDLVDRYRKHYRNDMGYRTILVNTTRGCPNRCSFCSVWKAANGNFLLREPADVVNEIVRVPDHISKVFFADDNTFINPGNARELCRLIREAGIRKKYSGYCRSDTIIKYPEMMREWKEIGLENLCVGFEGTDDRMLEKVNKKNVVSRNEEAARVLNELGIPFRPHFLIEPSFNKEDFRRIRRYVRKIRLNSPIFPILTPIPGTEHYDEVKDRIHIGYEYFDYAHAVIPTHLSPRKFYNTWISLYQNCYPVFPNLARFAMRLLGRLTGNRKMVLENHHLNLLHLLKLKMLSLILSIKLMKHSRGMERSGSG